MFSNNSTHNSKLLLTHNEFVWIKWKELLLSDRELKNFGGGYMKKLESIIDIFRSHSIGALLAIHENEGMKKLYTVCCGLPAFLNLS